MAQPNLSAYNSAQAQVDYSDIPGHGAASYGYRDAVGFSFGGPAGGAPMMPQQRMMNCSSFGAPMAMPMQSMAPPIASNSASFAPQAQQVQQVSDYIQPEQVMRHMNRKKIT